MVERKLETEDRSYCPQLVESVGPRAHNSCCIRVGPIEVFLEDFKDFVGK